MSAKLKPQSTEIDHIRDTLTDLVESVGEGNSKTQQVQQELSQFKHEVRERFDALERSTNERFDKVEETLAIIVNHLKK